MRFTITALGSAGGRTVGQVVDAIVRYLEPRVPEQQGPTLAVPAGDAPSSYYADRGSEAGRWRGRGADAMDLSGEVLTKDFALVLAGRDPHTGTRLLTARGSAGRRVNLGVGHHTRLSAAGERLYDMRDAAAALGVEDDDLAVLARAGTRLALGRALSELTGAATAPNEPAGSFLTPILDGEQVWITEGELVRCEAGRAIGPAPAEIAALGDVDDVLTLNEAARLSGLTPRYVRGLAARYERDRDDIAARRSRGERVNKAYLVAGRGVKGRWLVRRGDLVDFLGRRTAPAVRVGYDLTLTTEKSLAVLALLSPPSVRDDVLTAIETGNDVALDWLEQRAAVAQVGGVQVPAIGWTVASFRHLTSRALDPFPHHHNVVASGVETAGGERRALDARNLYLHAVGASAIATSEMRYQLTATLGVQWRRGRSGGWEIAGIPDDVLRAFSQRRTEIEAAVAELEEAIGRSSTIDELQRVVTSTRPKKVQADAADLVRDWWRRAAELGFTPKKLLKCVDRDVIDRTVDRDMLFHDLAEIDGITAGGSIFTRGDVLAAIVDAGIGKDDDERPVLVPASQLEAMADAFLASEHVVRLHPSPDRKCLRHLGDEPIFSTRGMLEVQQRVVEGYRRGLNRGAAQLDPAIVDAVLSGMALHGDQRSLVRTLCASGHRYQCAIGRAGAGKTTAMKAAAEAWRRAGYVVLGTAVKGEAARVLSATAGIPAETVAWHLARDRMGDSPLHERTVLIVDEASTLSDVDLDRIMRLAASKGTAVRLIGDPAQHGAVAAGGMFRVLCERHPGLTPELAVSRRVRDSDDRDAADALRDGLIPEALESLRRAGHLHIATDDADLYVQLLSRWWECRTNGQPHPLVERSNVRRLQFNRLARRLLQVHGEVGADLVEASGGRAFAIGDEVIARRGDRKLHPPGHRDRYVRNGMRGEVIGADGSGALVVRFEGVGDIAVPRNFYDEHRHPGGRFDVGLDHAYAVTSYAVQGATFGASTSRVDEGATRAEAYVDITRGIHENHLFATRAEDSLDGERLPKAPPPPIEAALTIRLAASKGEVTAWELHTHREQPSRSGMSRGLS